MNENFLETISSAYYCDDGTDEKPKHSITYVGEKIHITADPDFEKVLLSNLSDLVKKRSSGTKEQT